MIIVCLEAGTPSKVYGCQAKQKSKENEQAEAHDTHLIGKQCTIMSQVETGGP